MTAKSLMHHTYGVSSVRVIYRSYKFISVETCMKIFHFVEPLALEEVDIFTSLACEIPMSRCTNVGHVCSGVRWF